mmetsp:Transcript_81050/g.238195  ORF Transcript_81050/g.238195 Transcript_81050/m.238195 type:complete len:200 (+) Transcript_81050:2350-2949(+)
MDHGIGCDDHKLARIHTHNLELHGPESATHKKEVSLARRSVGLQEVGLQIGVKEVTGDALDGIVQGQNMHTLAVGHIAASMHRYDVAKAHAQVLAHDFVQADLRVLEVVVGKHDADGVLALLALDQHVVAAEEVQLLHLCLRHRDDGVVVVQRLLHNEAIGGPLFLWPRRCRRGRRWYRGLRCVCHGCAVPKLVSNWGP